MKKKHITDNHLFLILLVSINSFLSFNSIENITKIIIIDNSFLNSSSGKSIAMYAPIIEASTADIDNHHENLKLDTPFDLNPYTAKMF